MNKIVIFLTDPMKVFFQKGEIKERYYNPCDFFDEIHMISFCDSDISEDRIRSVGGRAKIFIYSVGGFGLFKCIRTLRKISSLLKHINPTVIRAYDPSVRGALAVFFGRRFKIPVVISVHSELDEQRKFDKRPELQLRKIFENYSIQNADSVICVTNYVGEYAKRHKAKKIGIIHNAVNLDMFNYQKSGKIFNKKTVLCVGRFDNPKRQDFVIKSMKMNNMNLVLIGEGKLKDMLMKLALQSGVSDRVSFMGSVPHNEIAQYYLGCDIFVMASDFEGFCIPIIEAMAAGKPIVASDIPAIRELLDDSGILVKNSTNSFAQALKLLCNDRDLCLALGKKARERAKIFDSSKLEEKERSIYERICRL